MKKINFVVIIFCLLTMIDFSKAVAASDETKINTAVDVVIECWTRYRGYIGTESAEIHTKTERDGEKTERAFNYRVKFIDNNPQNFEDITVTLLTEPIDKAGLGIYTHRKNGKNQIWIKQKSKNRLRKTSFGKNAYFAWTAIEEKDFGNFTGEIIDDFEWSFAEKQEKNHFVIIAIPKKGTDSSYEKRIILINKNNFSIYSIEYYKYGKKNKVHTNTNIVFFGKIWRVNSAIFEDIVAGETILTITDRKINNNLPEKYFKKNFLLR